MVGLAVAIGTVCETDLGVVTGRPVVSDTYGVELLEKKFLIPLKNPGLEVVVASGIGGSVVVITKCGRMRTWATSALAYDNCCKFWAAERLSAKIICY